MRFFLILLSFLLINVSTIGQSTSDSVMVGFIVNSGQYLLKIDGKLTPIKPIQKLTPGNHQVSIWSLGSEFLDTMITVQNVPSQMVRIKLLKNMTLEAEQKKATIYFIKRWVPGVGCAAATAFFAKKSMDAYKLRNEYYDEALKQRPLYDQADHPDEIMFYKAAYTNYKNKMYEQQRWMVTSIALSSVSAIAIYFCFRNYKSKKPRYTDPGMFKFENAYFDVSPRTRTVGLSINFSLR